MPQGCEEARLWFDTGPSTFPTLYEKCPCGVCAPEVSPTVRSPTQREGSVDADVRTAHTSETRPGGTLAGVVGGSLLDLNSGVAGVEDIINGSARTIPIVGRSR